MSWPEVAGFVLGLINIILLVRRSVWNFPVAMVMVSLVGMVLFRSRLYSEAGLQGFFFVARSRVDDCHVESGNVTMLSHVLQFR